MIGVSRTETSRGNIVTVLSIGSAMENQTVLRRIFNRSKWSLSPNFKWRLNTRATVDSALRVLRKGRIPVVLCEGGPQRDTWKEALDRLRLLPAPPALIVTSRLADDRLWAEALNLGAYDVLATPFDSTEVTRVVTSAWLHWRGLQTMPPQGHEERGMSAA